MDTTDMNKLWLITGALLAMLLSGCATNTFDAGTLLIDPERSIELQAEYVRATQEKLARYVASTEPDFEGLVLSSSETKYGTTYSYYVRDTWLPIGDGWLYLMCHGRSHVHLGGISEYRRIADLTIGLDDDGVYYFTRDHICGALGISAPRSGKYADASEFLVLNPSWHVLPRDWERTIPPAPPFHIAEEITGEWHAISLTSTAAVTGIDLEFTDASCHYEFSDADGWLGSGGCGYEVRGLDTVQFDGLFISGMLRFDGTSLIGTIEREHGTNEVRSSVRHEGIWHKADVDERP